MKINKKTETPIINHDELESVLKCYHNAKIPLFVKGKVGIGKSEIMKNYANKNKLNFIDIRLSLYNASDLKGLPIKYENNNGETNVKFAPLGILPPSDSSEQYLIFLDEINQAPPLVQSAAFQLILDRKIGDYVLPKNAYIVAAGNPIEDNNTAFEMSKPLKNRFAHIELAIPDKETWINWAIENNIENSIITFIEFKYSSLYPTLLDVNMNKNIGEEYNEDIQERIENLDAFATPRTWKYLDSLLKEIKGEEKIEKLILDNSKINFIEIISASVLGFSTSKLFSGFLKITHKLNKEDILNNFEKFWNNTQLTTEERWAAIQLILEELNPEKPQTIKRFLNLLDTFQKINTESKSKVVSIQHTEYVACLLKNIFHNPKYEILLENEEFLDTLLENKIVKDLSNMLDIDF